MKNSNGINAQETVAQEDNHQETILQQQQNKEERRKERQKIYSTKEWRELSRQMRMKYPLCYDCQKQGLITPSQEVHHIKSPFQRGISEEEKYRRAYDINNLVCLCKDCHHKRHEQRSIKDLLLKYSD